MAKITGSITMSGERNPFSDDGYSWTVKLRYERRKMTTPFYTGSLAGEPSLAEVVECLALDAAGYINSDGFEGWADEYGYDTDSRKAEATYKAVESQTRKLEQLLGEPMFSEVVWHGDDKWGQYVKEPS